MLPSVKPTWPESVPLLLTVQTPVCFTLPVEAVALTITPIALLLPVVVAEIVLLLIVMPVALPACTPLAPLNQIASKLSGRASCEQCEAFLAAAPAVVSSVMGLYSPEFVARMKQRGIVWFATVSTVAEARAAAAAGAGVIVAQGMEAGGHRGAFDADEAERRLVGLFALLPAVVDAVSVPVVAAGGIADARGVAAALALGASAVQIGTAFLRCPEAKLPPAWANALAGIAPEDTVVSRVFSGRAGRSLATAYVRAATAPDAPIPAPYPVQRGLTATMRGTAQKVGDVDRMQAWAGQAAGLAIAEPAAEVVHQLWHGARELLA